MLKTYHIQSFMGIDQSVDENGLNPSSAANARNIDTTFGSLSVGKGYVKHIASAIPGTDKIERLFHFQSATKSTLMAFSKEKIYGYDEGQWKTLYTFSPQLEGTSFDFTHGRIATSDYLLIATGEKQIMKFDGTTVTSFGTAANKSDIQVKYMSMYKGRLFSAGERANPSRLYYSKLPGDARSIEDWGPDTTGINVEGGHAEVGDSSADPIIALTALSNQLLIWKRKSVYRLIGDKPSNYVIERIDAKAPTVAHTALVHYGDVIYYLSKEGLFVYNGVTIVPTRESRQLSQILKDADLSAVKGALMGDKIYFAFKYKGASLMAEYDTLTRGFMLRDGFNIHDIFPSGEKLFLVNDTRYVYSFGEGATYDGYPINAYWQTPMTDLKDKGSIKSLKELYIRAKDGAISGALLLDVQSGEVVTTYRVMLPHTQSEVLEIPLKNEGRTFSIKFYNEAGGYFSIQGGVELLFGERRRT